MDLNTALTALVRAIERGSITGAARDIGMSQPAVTKHIHNLEAYVSARLLERSPQHVRPTDHGILLYESCKPALESIDAALELIRQATGEIKGQLRVHVPTFLGERFVYPLLMEFQELYPRVSIELVVENRNIDLIFENFDIALRYGKIDKQDIVVRRIGWIQGILAGSPLGVERSGRLSKPEQLASVEFLAVSAILTSRNTIPLVDSEYRPIDVPVKPVLVTNSGQVCQSAS